jgi:rod shape-determining protein MreD
MKYALRNTYHVAIPVMLVLALLQTAVLPHFTLFKLSPQLPLLVALAWGMLRGVDEGIVWAFLGGLFMDLFSITPLGLTALGYIVAVAAVLWAQEAFPASRFILPVLLAALATIIYLVLNLLLLRLLGTLSNLQIVATVWPLIIINALLMLPIYWLLYGIDRVIRPRRLQL